MLFRISQIEEVYGDDAESRLQTAGIPWRQYDIEGNHLYDETALQFLAEEQSSIDSDIVARCQVPPEGCVQFGQDGPDGFKVRKNA